MEKANRSFPRLDGVILSLLFLGVFIAPMHLRSTLLQKPLDSLRVINFPCALAALLSFARIRKWEKADFFLAAAWVLLIIPMFFSNRERTSYIQISAPLQLLLPLFLVFFRMEPDHSRKALGVFLFCFDLFMVFYLALGVFERFTNLSALTWARDQLSALGFKPSELTRYLEERDGRFASIWGHPLTNAFLFNAFFALNAVWLRKINRQKLTPVVFLFTLVGVLLCSSKMGIVVCLLLLGITCREQKKWFLLFVPLLGILYFTGALDRILFRFTEIDLTSGRLQDLQQYFSSGLMPLRFLSGYGSNAALLKDCPVYEINNAFEFPVMMYSFDYGILFSLVAILGVFAFVSWHMLRKRHWTSWLCYVCLFAEISAYNAYALRNQDVCWMMCIFSLFLLNLGEAKPAGNPGQMVT